MLNVLITLVMKSLLYPQGIDYIVLDTRMIMSLSFSLPPSPSPSLPPSFRSPPLASMLSTPTISRNSSHNGYDQQTPNTLNSSNANPPLIHAALTLPGWTPPEITSTLGDGPDTPPSQVPLTLGDGPITSPSQLLSPRRSRTRQYYGQNFSYIMDAKTKGNVGRYINVSP